MWGSRRVTSWRYLFPPATWRTPCTGATADHASDFSDFLVEEADGTVTLSRSSRSSATDSFSGCRTTSRGDRSAYDLNGYRLAAPGPVKQAPRLQPGPDHERERSMCAKDGLKCPAVAVTASCRPPRLPSWKSQIALACSPARPTTWLTAEQARVTRPLRSTRITGLLRYYRAVHPCASLRYSAPCGFCRLGISLSGPPRRALGLPRYRGCRFPRSARKPESSSPIFWWHSSGMFRLKNLTAIGNLPPSFVRVEL